MKNQKFSWNLVLEVVAALALVGTWVPMFYYGVLEGVQVPRHYSLAGVIDGWGGRGYILALAIISTVFYGLMWLCQRRPEWLNFWRNYTAEQKERVRPLVENFILQIKCCLMVMFFYINLTSLGIAMGFMRGMMSWVLYLLLALMFLSLTGFMLKTVGKRTMGKR